MWVVPNNWLETSISYLYLFLMYEIGGMFCWCILLAWFTIYPGMPLQTTTNYRSETTEVYGFVTTLKAVVTWVNILQLLWDILSDYTTKNFSLWMYPLTSCLLTGFWRVFTTSQSNMAGFVCKSNGVIILKSFGKQGKKFTITWIHVNSILICDTIFWLVLSYIQWSYPVVVATVNSMRTW